MSFKQCTQVIPDCPVEATIYGYEPNLAANTVFLAVFAACALLQIAIGVRFRTLGFTIALSLGCTMETIGYAGRVQMHWNPWFKTAFTLQIVCLVLAPTLFAAGIYLSLKRIILLVGPEYSRLSPQLYTWIFIGFDLTSILIQAAGGGIAASAKAGDQSELDLGNNLILAGMGVQVTTMAMCGLLALDFGVRAYRHRKDRQQRVFKTNKLLYRTSMLRMFCMAELVCFMVVLTRCIYRIPEMAGGWGNPLMRNETEFLTLDGAMIAIAAIAFTAFHPGAFAPLRQAISEGHGQEFRVLATRTG